MHATQSVLCDVLVQPDDFRISFDRSLDEPPKRFSGMRRHVEPSLRGPRKPLQREIVDGARLLAVCIGREHRFCLANKPFARNGFGEDERKEEDLRYFQRCNLVSAMLRYLLDFFTRSVYHCSMASKCFANAQRMYRVRSLKIWRHLFVWFFNMHHIGWVWLSFSSFFPSSPLLLLHRRRLSSLSFVVSFGTSSRHLALCPVARRTPLSFRPIPSNCL